MLFSKNQALMAKSNVCMFLGLSFPLLIIKPTHLDDSFKVFPNGQRCLSLQ